MNAKPRYIKNARLIAARETRGWSQEEVAELAGISVREYQRWEKGETNPNFESRRLLRQAFDSSDDALGFNDRRQIITFSDEELAAFADLLGLGGRSIMVHFDESKRDTLRKLLALAGTAVGAQILEHPEPWEPFITSAGPSTFSTEALVYFESLIGSVWGLSNQGELAVAGQTLSTFLPKLLHVAPHQPEAAMLSAQGLRLQSVLAAHEFQLQAKVALCEHAVKHARLVDEGNALVSSLTELAVAYKYIDQPTKSLMTYQEALTYVDQASSPLIQSRVYAAAASSFAKTGRKREARFYADLAQEAFPTQPEHDPMVMLADYGKWLLIFYTGSVHLDLGEYEQAWNVFESVNNLGIAVPERNRLEIRNHQGRAAIMLQDLDRYAICLEDSLTSSIALKSKKRYTEAVKIFREDMPQAWLREDPIQQLVQKFQLQQKDM